MDELKTMISFAHPCLRCSQTGLCWRFWLIIFDRFLRCCRPLSFQTHIIGFKVFNVFSGSFLVPITSDDLFCSAFRSMAPYYPAALSFLVSCHLGVLLFFFLLLLTKLLMPPSQQLGGKQAAADFTGHFVLSDGRCSSHKIGCSGFSGWN